MIYNYGHGASGFMIIWGCDHNVFELFVANLNDQK